ncbi:DctP family TRAP transporter solute-binding subunit [Allopusillimonas soli]|uniref:DctP family TRAP transporter solute-binding subunit n=1 Tax=Allopusillimonas soli TaxID=659016 RepID=A0A853FC23_9BURK|nr:DctP family TRAP transporter solute-binding subunit [Allopusillimonas soli]NYT36430.1 DctP family TRAP transporter solute-binding subunit [Allopusillimonas soli]TEA74940.1 DctP family TRAP transporter solute-binding subunit [Allopusillimonas soli]
MLGKRISKYLPAVAAAGLLSTTCLYGLNVQAKTTLKVGHISAVEHPWHQALVGMAEDVKKATNGEIVMQIYPSSQLGGEREMAQGLGLGVLEMGLFGTGALQALDKRMIIEELPYAWPKRENAYRALDGKLGDALAKVLEGHGITTLSWWESGYRHITNSVRPIEKPEDLKGIKLRVPEAEMRIDTFKILGALPTPMAFSEVFTALQQKVVDGQENPLATIYASKFYEVQDNLALTGHIWGSAVLTIATKTWNKLSEANQKIIMDAAEKWKLKEREMIAKSDDEALAKMKEAGIKVTTPDPTPFKEAVQPVWDKYENTFGSDLMGLVRKYSDS